MTQWSGEHAVGPTQASVKSPETRAPLSALLPTHCETLMACPGPPWTSGLSWLPGFPQASEPSLLPPTWKGVTQVLTRGLALVAAAAERGFGEVGDAVQRQQARG